MRRRKKESEASMNDHEEMATEEEVSSFLREKERIDKENGQLRWMLYGLYALGAIFLAWLIFGL